MERHKELIDCINYLLYEAEQNETARSTVDSLFRLLGREERIKRDLSSRGKPPVRQSRVNGEGEMLLADRYAYIFDYIQGASTPFFSQPACNDRTNLRTPGVFSWPKSFNVKQVRVFSSLPLSKVSFRVWEEGHDTEYGQYPLAKVTPIEVCPFYTYTIGEEHLPTEINFGIRPEFDVNIVPLVDPSMSVRAFKAWCIMHGPLREEFY